MILSLVGDDPERVEAIGARYLHRTIADVTTTHLSFPGGEQAHVFVSWLHPFKEQKLVVVGERGMAVFDDSEDWPRKVLLYPHSVEWREALPVARKAEAEPVPLEPGEPLRLECQHFLDCIRTGATPRTDGCGCWPGRRNRLSPRFPSRPRLSSHRFRRRCRRGSQA
jgi:UDP-2-acetamido-3-amino-2,3-dideoxy-glucuronate N-acetyltransferase